MTTVTTPPTRTLSDLLTTVTEKPGPLEYQAAARELERYGDRLVPVRIRQLASFTIDPLVPYLRVEAARHGFLADVHLGPFNSINQELIDGSSATHQDAPQIVFVTALLTDVCAPLTDDFLSLDEPALEWLLEDIVATAAESWRQFRRQSPSTLVIANFPLPQDAPLGIYEGMAERSQTWAIRRLNARLADAARGVAGVYILDLERLSTRLGLAACYDRKMWHIARAPLTTAALTALASTQAQFVRALLAPRRKCLVLDLDNTLWGGVVGEQGLAGIKIGQTYPGSAFRAFQQTVLSLHRRGVLLAINSKNNLEDVEQVFRQHPDMILKLEHFSAIEANWLDKIDNMRSIAAALNIGLDSLVFFDDSPVECESMRRALPEVLTITAPADSLAYADALLGSGAFERVSLTDEDRRRGELYRRDADRQRAAHSAASVEDFLQTLEMSAEIRAVDEFALPRAAELTQKTNQFNLTTRRYTAAQLTDALAAPDTSAFTLRLTDRFGDYGIVGLAIVHWRPPAAVIDTLLLSCRVIGRSAETALLSFLVDEARRNRLEALEGDFIPTSKNAPAADFFPRHRFTPVGDGAGSGAARWRLQIAGANVSWPACFQRRGLVAAE